MKSIEGFPSIVGQTRLIQNLNYALEGSFPHFVILHGPAGSGKTFIATRLANALEAVPYFCENKVDDVRAAIETAQTVTLRTMYLFDGVDRMSLAAKNALLKITEEAPQDAYFVMTARDLNQVLPTLRSRAAVYAMDGYLPEELVDYANRCGYDPNVEENKPLMALCQTPGDVDILFRYDIADFTGFVTKVVEHLGSVSGVNALKIPQSLSLKEGDSGWDISIFLRAVMLGYHSKVLAGIDVKTHREFMVCTSRTIQQLGVTGIHKLALIDSWILKMRGILDGGDDELS